MNEPGRATIRGIATALRRQRRALAALVLIAGGTWLLRNLSGAGRAALSLSPEAEGMALAEGGGELAKAWERIVPQHSTGSGSGSESAEVEDPCDFDALASLRLYVGMVRSIPDPRHRLDEIERPARELLGFPRELRRALGVLEPERLRLDFEFGRQRLELPLPDALMERWLACAI